MQRFLAGFLLSVMVFLPLSSDAYVTVKGYYRKDGTYVAPHVRSEPNGLKYDNYGYTPSQGLYNPTYGTKGAAWDTPTYITDPDYYEGKALYQAGLTPATIPVKTLTEAERTKLIQDLLAQVAALQAQILALKAAQGIQ